MKVLGLSLNKIVWSLQLSTAAQGSKMLCFASSGMKAFGYTCHSRLSRYACNIPPKFPHSSYALRIILVRILFLMELLMQYVHNGCALMGTISTDCLFKCLRVVCCSMRLSDVGALYEKKPYTRQNKSEKAVWILDAVCLLKLKNENETRWGYWGHLTPLS